MKTTFLYFANITLLLFCSCTNKKNYCDNNFIDIRKKNTHKILSEKFYENGVTSEIVYDLDSTSVFEQVTFSTVFYKFYKNGNLMEKGFQGVYKEFHIPVGTWLKYNETCQLISKTTFHNDTVGKDFILVEYFRKSHLVRREKSNNYILYENEKKLIKN